VIVKLEDGLFADKNIDPLLLLSLFRHGLVGRHVVVTDPPFPRKCPHFQGWLKARDPFVIEAVNNSLNRSFTEIQKTSTTVMVRVGAKPQSYWENNPPLLTPVDAAMLMEMPLHLVLEDRLTDKHFLLCVLPRPTRDDLLKYCKKGWFRVENGGGLGNMCRYVEFLKEEQTERLRTWVLFDRDTDPSGAPSGQSQVLKDACEAISLPHHQLWRRSIENYLPPAALYICEQRFHGKTRQEWTRLVDQFNQLPLAQRNHLNMKKHFNHGDIAKLFLEEKFEIKREWLEKDGQKNELEKELLALTQTLFERM
jgi:hypothetical protein